MIETRVPRRSVLKGLTLGAGASALQPFLSDLVREAHGATPGPRVVFLLSGNGYNADRVPLDLVQDGQGPGGRFLSKVQNLPFKQVPDSLKPLQPFADRMLIFDDSNCGLGSGHYQTWAPMAQVANVGGENGSPGGKTVDLFIGERIGASAALPLVTLGTAMRASDRLTNAFSARDRNQPILFPCKPAEVNRVLFAAGASKRDAYLLDDLREDVQRASARLAGSEKAKLDQYLTALAVIQRRQMALAGVRGGACKAPPPPPMDLAFPETRAEAMVDLATAILICGMTRVVSLSIYSGRQFSPEFTRLGYTVSMHSLGHGAADPKMGRGELPIRQWQAGLIGTMATELRKIPEGNGNMFDNTLFVLTNDNGTSHHSRTGNGWWVAMVGNAGGRLKADGRYVRFPSSGPDHRKLADIWTTVCNAVGVKVDHFNPDAPVEKKGPIDYLLA
jgi:hypothetical protein